MVRILMTLQEPNGPTADLSEPMPVEVARAVQEFLIPIGGFRWDPAERIFVTGEGRGFHVLRTEVLDEGQPSGLD